MFNLHFILFLDEKKKKMEKVEKLEHIILEVYNNFQLK